ncbi:integrase [Nonomuraea sp. NPDC059194]|uniref:integrase n=1 Tax=Nonomuraea sp. NPDC059194 TaxID=3346764 RepID=UPI00369CDC99
MTDVRLTLATEPAYPDRPNEDFIGATSNAVVLLDGAGTPAGLQSGCSHGVAWFSHTLGSTLVAGITQNAGPLTEILASGIKETAAQHDTCDLDHPGTPSAIVVMLRRTGDTLDWLILADSVLVLDIIGAEPMVICDERESIVGKRYRGPMNEAIGGTPQHSDALSVYISAMRGHRNIDGGFWVAATNPHAAEQALTGSAPVDQIRTAAMLSDGASRLVDRFHLATWRQCLDLLEHDGPDVLIRRVRAAERSDLDGSRWKRGKIFDDATAAYWTFA